MTNCREIKFRAWHEAGKEWVDDIVLDTRGNYYISNRCEFEGDNRKLIICQYTGLKDKNGKEIYEGDVVRFEPNSIEYPEDIFIFEVVWFKQGCGFLFKISNERYDALDVVYQDRLEVIGNIYENPELIKETK